MAEVRYLRPSVILSHSNASQRIDVGLYGAMIIANPVRKLRLQIKDLSVKVTGSKLCVEFPLRL